MKRIIIDLPDGEEFTVEPAIVAKAIRVSIETIADRATKPARSRRVIRGKSVLSAVMEHYTASGAFNQAVAENWITKAGYAASSASAAVSRLVSDGYVKRVGPGRWLFLKPWPEFAGGHVGANGAHPSP